MVQALSRFVPPDEAVDGASNSEGIVRFDGVESRFGEQQCVSRRRDSVNNQRPGSDAGLDEGSYSAFYLFEAKVCGDRDHPRQDALFSRKVFLFLRRRL